MNSIHIRTVIATSNLHGHGRGSTTSVIEMNVYVIKN